MGFYINPKVGTKEQWLAKHGIKVEPAEAREFYKDCDHPPAVLLVVLIQNPEFSAAGVAYTPREALRFTNPYEPRPRQYFAVLLKNLLEDAGLPADFEEIRKKHWALEKAQAA